MHEETEADSISVTQRNMMDFLVECGAGTHSTCPRCGKDDWDSAAKQDEIVATVTISQLQSPSQAFANYRLTFGCENCGFTENFSAIPFYRWLSKELKIVENG